jgi:hypothetical protein
MSHTAQVTASLKTIPAHRWRQKIARLVIAAGLGALLYFVALPQHWSPALDLGLAAAIGYCVSADLMKALARFLVALIRDMLAAIKTEKSDGPV